MGTKSSPTDQGGQGPGTNSTNELISMPVCERESLETHTHTAASRAVLLRETAANCRRPTFCTNASTTCSRFSSPGQNGRLNGGGIRREKHR